MGDVERDPLERWMGIPVQRPRQAHLAFHPPAAVGTSASARHFLDAQPPELNAVAAATWRKAGDAVADELILNTFGRHSVAGELVELSLDDD